MTDVERGHEMTEVKRMPMRMAPRTRYIISTRVKILERKKIGNFRKDECETIYPPVKMPNHIDGLRRIP